MLRLKADDSGQAAALPDDLRHELDQTRRPGRGDASETPAIAGVSVGLLKLRVVPGVKKLDAKL
jgi:hypothetical protein